MYTTSFSRTKVLTKESKRKFFFKYAKHHKGERSKAVPLEFGTMVHELMDHVLTKPKHLRKKILMNKVAQMITKMSKEDSKIYETRLLNVVPVILKLLDEYRFITLEEKVVSKVKDIDPDSKIGQTLWELTPEKYRTPEGITSFGILGYIDAFCEQDGKTYVIDWKTGSFTIQKFKDYKEQGQQYAHQKRLKGDEVDGIRIVWIEQNGLTKEVPADAKTCERVFNAVGENFLNAVENGIKFCDLEDDCSGKPQSWCEYSAMCAVIDRNLNFLSDDFIKLILEDL
jgi:hypothetical protein